ncbi:MAG: Fis family transcriptional regulator [Oscillospiraceae bacterium]|nr:Fis family transcriptional regulator [Oscillospiraceae bacterium]
MKGTHHIEVKNRDAVFKFDLCRNITIVRGDSGTGKTTLYDMIADYTRLKEASGVNVSCDKPCAALTDIDWRNQLNGIKDSIVFIDEGADFLNTREFAGVVKNTDNYYVIFNRESLHELPYSVEEIYEISSSGKYHKFKKMFRSNSKHIYYKDKAPTRLKV